MSATKIWELLIVRGSDQTNNGDVPGRRVFAHCPSHNLLLLRTWACVCTTDRASDEVLRQCDYKSFS